MIIITIRIIVSYNIYYRYVCSAFSAYIYIYIHIHAVYTYLYVSDVRCDNLSISNGGIGLCSSGRVGVGYEGDTCNFTCETGFELIGSETRTCQSDGSWSGTDGLCRRGMYACTS